MLEQRLVSSLVGLARAAEGNEHMLTDDTLVLILEALHEMSELFRTDATRIDELVQKIKEEKFRIVPDCAGCMAPCGRTNDFDAKVLVQEGEEVKKKKEKILEKLIQWADQIYITNGFGLLKDDMKKLFYKALFYIGLELDLEYYDALIKELEESIKACGGN